MARIQVGPSMSLGWIVEGVERIYEVDLVDRRVGMVWMAGSCSKGSRLGGSCGS